MFLVIVSFSQLKRIFPSVECTPYNNRKTWARLLNKIYYRTKWLVCVINTKITLSNVNCSHLIKNLLRNMERWVGKNSGCERTVRMKQKWVWQNSECWLLRYVLFNCTYSFFQNIPITPQIERISSGFAVFTL